MHVCCLDRGHTRDRQRMEQWIERNNKPADAPSPPTPPISDALIPLPPPPSPRPAPAHAPAPADTRRRRGQHRLHSWKTSYEFGGSSPVVISHALQLEDQPVNSVGVLPL